MAQKKRCVAVLGGGVCGLCSIKSLLEEGMEVVCFEKTDFYGGTWCYHEEDLEGVASVMWTTVANNSKEMSSLSDFPSSKDTPNYMHHKQLYFLIQMYAHHFDVVRHIRFKHEVIHVEQADDYEQSGRWSVTYKDLATDKVMSENFDGVMVCTGQFGHPNIPVFPGQKKFKGEILHTKSLKKFNRFDGKRLVVVGIGCSGVDAATEGSNFAQQVYLSTRKGGWVLPRTGPYGLPFDSCYLRRWSNILYQLCPLSFICWFCQRIVEHLKFNHTLYSLRPEHGVWEQEPVFSDQLGMKIMMGAVIVKGNIKSITEKGVIFEGETKVTEVDTIIMATGYKWKFPFLADGIITKDGDVLNLYKCMFPPHLKHPTLCLIGFILPLGPGFPMGEAQCRWASLLMNQKLSLPTEEDMLTDIRGFFEKNKQRYRVTDRLTTKVDYIEYLDDITSKFGAKPKVWKYLFTDPKLFRALFFGPCLPYQYRLEGPHAWPGAREAILSFKERMTAPLRRNAFATKTKKHTLQQFSMKLFLALLVFIFWIVAET